MYKILSVTFINKWMSFKGHSSVDQYHFCRNEFASLGSYNQKVRKSGFAGSDKVVEVHSNTTHGGIECKFVNKDTSVCIETVSSPTPSGVDEQDYKDNFVQIFGNSELSPDALDVFPFIEKINNTPDIEQLDIIISSICTLFN